MTTHRRNGSWKTALLGIGALAGVAILSLPAARAASYEIEATGPFAEYEPWSEEAVAAFARIPVQQGGRIMPMDTVARFTLLQFHQMRSLKFELTGEGEGPRGSQKLSSSEWLMDVIFRPELAKAYPTFTINDSDVLLSLGIEPKGKKRDRYSYNDLLQGRQKLSELAATYRQKEQQSEMSKDKSMELERKEKAILALGTNVSMFEHMASVFEFAKQGYFLNPEIVNPEMVELSKRLEITGLLERMPEMQIGQLMQDIQRNPAEITDPDEKALVVASQVFFFRATTSNALALFPPQDADTEEWMSPSDLMIESLADKELRPWAIERLERVKTLVEQVNSPEGDAAAALTAFAEPVRAEMEARGEGEDVGLEVTYHRIDFYYNAMVLFIFGFVMVLISWFSPASRLSKFLSYGIWGTALAGVLLIIAGMVVRCMIRDRPAPITNLYDTTLFITAGAVILTLIIEWMTRRRIALALAVILGMAGMMLSIRYEAKEAADTMNQLVAVLDSNFWLLTHVTTINIGYLAGLVAAAFAHVYIIVRLIHGQNQDREFNRVVSRIIYGVICFCLFFSLVGTVLGGIWANYSWGRFWGWDPKENGALMIVLWTLAQLHARMGGYIRELGVAITSIILGGIVSFSWWGVNNLGVGLHSYGFTQGVWGALYTFWIIEGVVIALGVALWIQDRAARAAKEEASRAEKLSRGEDGGLVKKGPKPATS